MSCHHIVQSALATDTKMKSAYRSLPLRKGWRWQSSFKHWNHWLSWSDTPHNPVELHRWDNAHSIEGRCSEPLCQYVPHRGVSCCKIISEWFMQYTISLSHSLLPLKPLLWRWKTAKHAWVFSLRFLEPRSIDSASNFRLRPFMNCKTSYETQA